MLKTYIGRQFENFKRNQEREKIHFNTNMICNDVIFGKSYEDRKSSISKYELPAEPIHLIGAERERYISAREFIFRTYREIIAMEEGEASSSVFNHFKKEVIEFVRSRGRYVVNNDTLDAVLMSGMTFQNTDQSDTAILVFTIIGVTFDTIRGTQGGVDDYTALEHQVRNIPLFEKLISGNSRFVVDALYSEDSKLEI